MLKAELIQDCTSILQFLPSGFIFQQDGTPAHTAKLAQGWITANCSEFIGKDEWPPDWSHLNSLDYHVQGAMLKRYKSFQPSQRTPMSSRKFCSWYGTSCHRTRSTLRYWAFRKRLLTCVKAGGGHFEHTIQELSYRKQIARQLCTRFVEGIYRFDYAWPWKLGQGSLKITGNGTIG